ncbi:MAG: DUF3343 domain-containing protein [Bacillota bacterium]|nr:DUF3343 domain-containing protein [Bacillota bacterium]
MGMYVFRYKSVSQAERAIELLKKHGYRGYIKRTSPSEGISCGFSVYVDTPDERTAADILKKNMQ